MTSLSKALALASAWLDGNDDGSPLECGNAVVTDADGPSSNSNSSNHLTAGTATTTTTAAANTNPIERAISLLLEIQTQMTSLSITISNNESLEDVSTPALELMSVTYHLARAYLMLPTNIITPTNNTMSSQSLGSGVGGGSSSSNNPSLMRKHNVTTAMEYFHLFLKQLDQLGDGILSEGTLKEYHALLDSEQQLDDDVVNGEAYNNNANTITTNRQNNRRQTPALLDPNQLRTMKIQRYQRKQMAQTQKQQLSSLSQRRNRLGLSDNEQLDGHDRESLLRSLHIETLRVYAEEALEEINASIRELEMIDLSIKYNSSSGGVGCGSLGRSTNGNDDVRMNSRSSRHGVGSTTGDAPPPLQLTQITHNPITGQLQLTKQQVTKGGGGIVSTSTQIVQRQQIQEGVFRPGWNLPTMSLEDLAHRETYEAIQRSEAQKLAEANAIYKPRRYDQLERDGMEDDVNLVEASAQLDREWDSWKEENPRGSGNKLGERGDRNF